MEHYSVLLQESINALHIKPNGIYVDGTLGRGGHSEAILKELKDGRLYAFDKDETAIRESAERLKGYSNCTLIRSDFRYLKEELLKAGVTEADGFLFDLGVSSPQFDDPERGFSYRYDAKLDMRMDQSQALSAYEVVNQYDEKDLVRIFKDYGEEPFAKPIAKAIVAARKNKPVTTTLELVDIIKSALPQKVLFKHKHPAKQVFQALRIEVNDELGALREVLSQAISMLSHDGYLAVITFHSLEDRLVKQTFHDTVNVDRADRKIPVLPNEIPQSEYELVNRKPIEASTGELEENNRSHSAKLRVIRRK